uniref:Uncharacterized protein n=1 Tax=Anopheles coluzzii TaxID=1518534 RepID=A0A8W7PVY0_ANOCL
MYYISTHNRFPPRLNFPPYGLSLGSGCAGLYTTCSISHSCLATAGPPSSSSSWASVFCVSSRKLLHWRITRPTLRVVMPGSFSKNSCTSTLASPASTSVSDSSLPASSEPILTATSGSGSALPCFSSSNSCAVEYGLGDQTSRSFGKCIVSSCSFAIMSSLVEPPDDDEVVDDELPALDTIK